MKRFWGISLLILCLSVPYVRAQFPYRIPDKKTFFEHIDLDYPGLGEVKSAVSSGNYDRAVEAYLLFFRHRTDRRFNFNGDVREKTVAGLRRHYPEHERQVLDRAARVMSFTLDIQDRTHRWPDGDITWRDQNQEWINLLNRMEYLIDLGQAYWYTGEEKYFDNFWHWYTDWLQDNPPPDYQPEMYKGTWEPHVQSYTAPHGPWRALEVGIRLSHILPVFYYFDDAEGFTPEKKWVFLRSLMEQQRYIYAFLQREALGNWENFTASGFLPLAVLTPEWDNSADILSFCRGTLNKNLWSAVNDEGFQFELTVHYHKHVVPNGVKMQYFLTELNGLEGLEERVVEKVKKSYDIIARMKKPDNDDPHFGDSGYFFHGLEPEEVRGDPFFSDAALVYKDPFHKALSGGFAVNDYIFYGEEGYRKYLDVPRTDDPRLASDFLPVSGVTVMRSGPGAMDTTRSSLYCLFDNSPDGAGAHQHHDFLNLELFAYDKTLIIDPGYGNHYNDPLFGRYYRAVRGHNVIQVGEKGDFQLRKRGAEQVRNEAWESNDVYDYARAVMKDFNGVDHYRELFFVKGEYWFLRDRLEGEGTQLIKQYFHTLPGELTVDNAARTVYTRFAPCSNICWIPAVKEELALEVENGYVATGKENLEAPVVTYSKQKELPVTFETVLYPLQSGASVPDFKMIPVPCNESGDQNDYFGCRFEASAGKTDYFFISAGDRPVTFGQHASLNGTFAFCREQEEYGIVISLRGKEVRWKEYELISERDTDAYLARKGNNSYTCYSREPLSEMVLRYEGRIRWPAIHAEQDGEVVLLPVLSHDPARKTVTVSFPYTGQWNIRIGKQ